MRAGTSRVICGIAAAAIVGSAGCTAWRGARLYQSGSRALERGDVAVALADLRTAAELVPDASAIQNHLGLAQQAAGDDEAARASFEKAVALDCDNDAARENLARIEARLLRASAVDAVSSPGASR